MGEVLRGLRALAETISLRDEQARQLHEIVRADIATLRQDQRDLDEKLDCVICVAQHDLESLKLRAADDRRSVEELVKALRAIRSPLAEMMALRSRMGGIVVGLAMVGSAVLWLAAPFYRWLIDHNLPRQ
jgi:hypothetical protein